MNAQSHEFDLAQATMLPPAAAPTMRAEPDPALLREQWEAIHEAAGAIASLAGLGREAPAREIAALPQRIAQAEAASYVIAAHAIEDLAAFMQPGLRALLGLTAQGQDATAAALTLWREFHTARAAILDLAKPR